MSVPERKVITQMRHRFRGFLPVIVDVETAGIDPQKNALLEMCIVLIDLDDQGRFFPKEYFFEHILPFKDSVLDAESLAFNQIDPFQPLRFAIDEKRALERLFLPIEHAVKHFQCSRAVLVGHNAWFDLLFLKAAVKRTGVHFPFHAFTCFDTATLAGMTYGQTVLAKAAKEAGILFDQSEAHSAIYDAQKTAELFCVIANMWHEAGFPLTGSPGATQ